MDKPTVSLIVSSVALSLCVVVTVAFGVLAGFLCCALHILRAEVALLSKSLWFWVHLLYVSCVQLHIHAERLHTCTCMFLLVSVITHVLHRHTVLLLLVSVHITACDYSILLHRHTVLLLLVSVHITACDYSILLHRHTVLHLLVSVHITACDYSILLHRHTVLLLLVYVYCVAAFCCTDFVGGCVFAVSLIFTCSDTSVCAPLQNLCLLYHRCP